MRGKSTSSSALRRKFLDCKWAIFLFPFLLLFLNVPNAQEPMRRLIQVEGHATMRVAPDTATLSIGVETQDVFAKKAQEKLTNQASKILGRWSRQVSIARR